MPSPLALLRRDLLGQQILLARQLLSPGVAVRLTPDGCLVVSLEPVLSAMSRCAVGEATHDAPPAPAPAAPGAAALKRGGVVMWRVLQS